MTNVINIKIFNIALRISNKCHFVVQMSKIDETDVEILYISRDIFDASSTFL